MGNHGYGGRGRETEGGNGWVTGVEKVKGSCVLVMMVMMMNDDGWRR